MSETPESGDKPKIIIDEDWKSQVEAEREAAKAKPAGEQPTGDKPADVGATAPPQGEDPPMPPASFEMLVTGLATEAMMAMGQIPHPATGEAVVRRNQAKYVIDTIDVLRDKTKGNLDPVEDQAIENLLHELRMAFVSLPKS